jgi:hypothetical protein
VARHYSAHRFETAALVYQGLMRRLARRDRWGPIRRIVPREADRHVSVGLLTGGHARAIL